MRIRYMWLVVKANGRMRNWVAHKNRGEQPDEFGMVTLDGGKYVVNPSKLSRWTFRGKEYAVQVWKEGSADSVDLFGEVDSKFTPQTISKMSKAKRLEKLIQPPSWDIVKIALVLSLIANMIIIAMVVR